MDVYKIGVFTSSNLFQFGTENEIQDIAMQEDDFIMDCFLYLFDAPILYSDHLVKAESQ